jgi:hypothetical protein
MIAQVGQCWQIARPGEWAGTLRGYVARLRRPSGSPGCKAGW